MISSELMEVVWLELEKSVIHYRGEPLGTAAAGERFSGRTRVDAC